MYFAMKRAERACQKGNKGRWALRSDKLHRINFIYVNEASNKIQRTWKR